MWWVGAAGLVVGNVIIGRREEEGDGAQGGEREREGERENASERAREGYRDQEDEAVEEIEMDGDRDGDGLVVKEGLKAGVIREREVGG